MKHFVVACALLGLVIASGPPFPVSFAEMGVPGTIAQTRIAPSNVEELKLSFAPIVQASAPSVVNVYASRVVQQRLAVSPLFDDPFFRRFLDDRMLPMPRERVQSSLGSGVIVREEGIIVTNNHVIAGAEKLTVALADRREFDAEIILADERTDLAVLRIDTGGTKLPAIAFADSDTAEVGDIVLAIGNPFGVGQTVTNGIVSALARTRVGVTDYQFFIQTDAAINPGNSGGALVGVDGKLLGINTAIFSRSGGSNGIGFAIPANMVHLVVDQAVAGGKIVRPWFGADGQTVDSTLALSLGLERPQGIILTSIHPDGPAAKAGLTTGDLVLAIDGFEISDIQALRYRVAIQKPGVEVPILILRKGKQQAVRVRLSAPPETPPLEETRLEGRQPLAGATVINLSPAANEAFGLDPMASGVMVVTVERGSLARRYGFGPGDIIRGVAGEEIADVASLVKALSRERSSWHIEIERNGRTLQLNVRG